MLQDSGGSLFSHAQVIVGVELFIIGVAWALLSAHPSTNSNQLQPPIDFYRVGSGSKNLISDNYGCADKALHIKHLFFSIQNALDDNILTSF